MSLLTGQSPMRNPFQRELEGEPVTVSSTNSREKSFPKNEDIIWRKVDIHLVPWLAVLSFLNFLDRVNIANAKIAGMAEDLSLTGMRYNTTAAVYFMTYCLVEIPSNIVLKLYRPSRWVPSLIVAWGTVTIFISMVKTYQGLVIARLFLGLAEGGLFPGLIYYISTWYPRRMQAKRIAILPASGCVGAAVGGILAYCIEHLDGTAGLRGWRWIFLLEGLGTIFIAFLSYFLMHDYPDTATFLTRDEWQFVVEALREDSKGQPTHFSVQFIWQALRDWKTYALSIVYFGLLTPKYAMVLFLPSIINDLGFSAAGAQLMAAPPLLCAGIISVIFGIYSDKMKMRGPFIVFGAAVSMIGFIIAYTTSKPGISYAATIIAASGVYPTTAVALTWAGGNAGGDLKRGVVFATVIGIGNLGGICASYTYYQPPRYYKGHGTSIGCLAMSIIVSSLLMWKAGAHNKKMDAMCLREGIDSNMEDKYSELGDNSPLYRYII